MDFDPRGVHITGAEFEAGKLFHRDVASPRMGGWVGEYLSREQEKKVAGGRCGGGWPWGRVVVVVWWWWRWYGGRVFFVPNFVLF